MNKALWIAIIVIVVIGVGAYFVLGQQRITNQADQGLISTPLPLVNPTTQQTPSSNDSTGSAAAGAVKEFTVEGSPFKLAPASMRVNVGDRLRITFMNVSGKHDFVIDEFGVKTKTLDAGGQETVEFVASQKGTFKYYCSVPGHRAQGMEGTLVVE